MFELLAVGDIFFNRAAVADLACHANCSLRRVVVVVADLDFLVEEIEGGESGRRGTKK
jgi:hypothetical protein